MVLPLRQLGVRSRQLGVHFAPGFGLGSRNSPSCAKLAPRVTVAVNTRCPDGWAANASANAAKCAGSATGAAKLQRPRTVNCSEHLPAGHTLEESECRLWTQQLFFELLFFIAEAPGAAAWLDLNPCRPGSGVGCAREVWNGTVWCISGGGEHPILPLTREISYRCVRVSGMFLVSLEIVL